MSILLLLTTITGTTLLANNLEETHKASISEADVVATRVSGIVLDGATNEPLEGVTVVVKGTQVGAFTDAEGRFTVDVPDNANILVLSYINFRTQEVEINGQTELTISLEQSIGTLDEVVVVGYGTQKKSHLTGSISKVVNEKLDQIGVARVDDALIRSSIGGQYPGKFCRSWCCSYDYD